MCICIHVYACTHIVYMYVHIHTYVYISFPGGLVGKESTSNAEDAGDAGCILGLEGPLEEGMATYFSILAWRIPRTEEPGGLQSIGLQRVRHD